MSIPDWSWIDAQQIKQRKQECTELYWENAWRKWLFNRNKIIKQLRTPQYKGILHKFIGY